MIQISNLRRCIWKCMAIEIFVNLEVLDRVWAGRRQGKEHRKQRALVVFARDRILCVRTTRLSIVTSEYPLLD